MDDAGQNEANEQTYMEMLARREDADLLDVSRRLLDWANERGLRLEWRNVRDVPQFAPVIESGAGPRYFVEVTARGRIDVLFDQMAQEQPFDDREVRLEVVRRLNRIPGMGMPDFVVDKRPTFSLNALVSPEAFAHFTSTFDWVASQMSGQVG